MLNLQKITAVSIAAILGLGLKSTEAQNGVPVKIPVVDVTDLYFPYQDPGDNFDLIMAYALPNIELKAVLLDITNAFRKPVADAPYLWHDPYGPREAGIIPVEQLNYIFNRNVPFGVGPFCPMKYPEDKMLKAPAFQQSGVRLLLKILRESKRKVNILSFGSARIIAVAYNRDPDLLLKKVKMIYLNAGTASPDFEFGNDSGANSIPGGEWNVALDKWAFIRLLRSNLPIAIYPPASKDGAFALGHHNTYWKAPSLQFVRKMNIKLQRYLDYAFEKTLSYDFLRAMDVNKPADSITIARKFPAPHNVWETALWLQVSDRKLIERNGYYQIIPTSCLKKGDKVLSGQLEPCLIHVRDDGRFTFKITNQKTNFWIYDRSDPELNQTAFQQALPELYILFKVN